MREFKFDESNKIGPGFNPPDNYFDTVHHKVLARIEEPPQVIPLYRRRIFQLGVAAVIFIAFGLICMMKFESTKTVSANHEIAELIYIENNLPDEEIAALLDDSDIAAIKSEVAPDIEQLERSLELNPEIEHYITN